MLNERGGAILNLMCPRLMPSWLHLIQWDHPLKVYHRPCLLSPLDLEQRESDGEALRCMVGMLADVTPNLQLII